MKRTSEIERIDAIKVTNLYPVNGDDNRPVIVGIFRLGEEFGAAVSIQTLASSFADQPLDQISMIRCSDDTESKGAVADYGAATFRLPQQPRDLMQQHNPAGFIFRIFATKDSKRQTCAPPLRFIYLSTRRPFQVLAMLETPDRKPLLGAPKPSKKRHPTRASADRSALVACF
ncbi:MAG: hypothetical protein KGK33_04160 [Hyphomicrobiales bacterium]|nr:hypothetical protein [Hyphomicrobiales bacterium]